MVEHRALEPDGGVAPECAAIAVQHGVRGLLEGEEHAQGDSDRVGERSRQSTLLHGEVAEDEPNRGGGRQRLEARRPFHTLDAGDGGEDDRRKQGRTSASRPPAPAAATARCLGD